MQATILGKTMRDQRRGLIGWSIAVSVLIGVMAALWPSVRDLPNLDELMAAYPEGMRELFNIDAIGTGIGYLNAELFSLLLPILLVVFGVGRGARLIAGEEQDGSLEVLLSTPASRPRILTEKAIALSAAVAILGTVVLASTAMFSLLLGMGIAADDLAAGTLRVTLLGIQFGLLALAVGAATGRKGRAIGVAGAVATVSYVLYVMGALVEVLEPWAAVSPFRLALEGGPLGAGAVAGALWLGVAAAIVVFVSVPLFDRRDIHI